MINGLYDVPQTDSTGEAAMAALVARLRAAQPKPETIPLESAVPGTDASLALQLFRSIAIVCAALGDKVGDGATVIRWDAALDGACCDITYRTWLNRRGRNRGAGADTSIDAVADEALAFLARCRPDGDTEGKTESPRFDDSSSNIPGDRGRFKSSPRADSWVCGSRGDR